MHLIPALRLGLECCLFSKPPILCTAINEFTSPDYSQLVPYPPLPPYNIRPFIPIGEVYLKSLGFKTSRTWIWLGVAYLLSFWAFFLTMTCVAMHCIRWGGRDTVPLTVDETPEARARKKTSTMSHEDEEDPKLKRGDSGLIFSTGGGAYQLLEEGLVFRPVSLVFREIWYSVDLRQAYGKTERVELLKGVSGYAKPGTMTALMGSSGE